MKKYTFKKKTLITGAIFSIFGLVGVMGLQPKQYESAKAVELYSENVIYDEDHNTITLTNEELNNYTFNNLVNYLVDQINNHDLLIDDIFTEVDYSENTTTIIDSDTNFYYFQFENNTYNIILAINDAQNFPYDEELLKGHFYYCADDFSFDGSFNYSLTLTIPITLYSSVRNAIELDIEANQPISQGDSMIGAITSGLGLAPQVANEFVKGFSAIFWDTTNQQLTKVSNFMLVMLGIAIVMACIKLALYLLRNNTGA